MSTDLTSLGAPVVSCSRIGLSLMERTFIEEAFREIPSVALQQTWSRETNFRPGSAKVAHTDTDLLVLTDFEDDDVFNPIAGFNEPAYQHGDVCEVFWLPNDVRQYAEIHVTPEGSIWQAVFPIDWMEKKRKGLAPQAQIEDLNVWAPQPQVLNWRTRKGWSTFLGIPFSLLGTSTPFGKIAICRYDYTRGESKPVLTSTADFPICDFHRHEYWSELLP